MGTSTAPPQLGPNLEQVFPDSSAGKESTCYKETWVRSLGREDPLEKGKAAHSSILAWRIPWSVQSAHGSQGRM